MALEAHSVAIMVNHYIYAKAKMSTELWVLWRSWIQL